MQCSEYDFGLFLSSDIFSRYVIALGLMKALRPLHNKIKHDI